MKTSVVSAKIAALSIALIVTAAGCRREDVTTYTVPREKAAPPSMAAASTDIPTTPNAQAPSWQTPANWKELAPTSIRIGNLLVEGKDGKKAEVAITSFPGSVGSELDNWNRWRGEIGLGPTGEDKVASKPVKVGEDDAKLYDMTGDTLRTVVAMLPRGGATWFFKMRGDKDVVAEAKSTFVDFLKTIHFKADAVAQPPTDPHAGIPGAPPLQNVAGTKPAVATETSDEEDDFPKLDLSSAWKKTPAPPMVLRSYAIGDGEVKLAISSLGGMGGGVLMNVNRWRGQLGLEPIAEQDLPKHTTTIDAGGSKAIVVDVKGTEVKTGNPARMVTVMVPMGDVTWFYKMTGEDGAVGREKNALIKAVQGARYE